METEINVAATLKDKPQGVKLYSRICGAVELKEVLDVRKKKSIVVKELNSSNQHRFWYDGKFFRAGQCVLQPSKEMADWSKFSWKRGDVLVCKDVNSHIIFEKFNDDTYTTFTGKHYLAENDKGEYNYVSVRYTLNTRQFCIEEGDAVQTYISNVEKEIGYKLNRETLKIEKAQPEFKNGDMVSLEIRYIDSEDVIVETYIVHGDYNYGEELNFHAGCNNLGMIKHNSCVKPTNTSVRKVFIRYATDSEKQQLFSALAKENKAWDSEKKEVVDLKPKVELKPFDKVLVRDNEDDIWEVSLFGYKDELYYRCDNGIPWIQCIPYDGNEHLLGTTNNVEG